LTGVVYDPDTLLHKSTSLHVEGPNRVASILDQFETSGLFKHSNVERVASIPLAQREHIAAVHPPEYIYFVDNVWPSEK
jgi:acetoin utilization deacetylase AcuC-like enzyme